MVVFVGSVTEFPVAFWILSTRRLNLYETVMPNKVFDFLQYSPVLARQLVLTCLLFPAALFASEDLAMPPSMADAEVQSTVSSQDNPSSGFNLVNLLQSYYAKKIPDHGNGLKLARLFGEQGIAIKVSISMPEVTYYSLRAGSSEPVGDLGENDLTQAFVFAQKRW